MKISTIVGLTMAGQLLLSGAAMAEDITIGFAIAKSGWLEAYDTPAVKAAKIRIDEINAAGGLLGKQIKYIEADTRADRAEASMAALDLIDQDVDMMIVSCDYDYGAPAALVAESEGLNSFFLCAEDVKAGIQGVGPNSFSASVLGAVQGATVGEWSYNNRDVRTAFVLEDSFNEYNKSICTGFEWMFPQLDGAEIIGKDTFQADDASIAGQISRIKALPEEPDAIMLCSTMPGAAAALRQIRASGIESAILNGSAVDGSYWLDAVPNLSNFYVPVQGSIYGDDPRPEVEAFNVAYEEVTGGRPSSQYVYPGYVLIDLWAKAVERAGTTDADAVTAELEKMDQEATIFGPRTFTNELHHQNATLYQIIEITDSKPARIDEWTISKNIPLDVLLAQ